MAKPQVQVEGLDDLRKNLRKLDKDLAKGLTKIHKALAEPVADKARARAPRRTGKLAGSVKPSGTQRAALIRAGVGLKPYNYAGISEYGGYPGAYPGHPFMIPTIEAESDRIILEYEDMIHDFVETVWEDSFA
jgi:HK97 gp10 family phage protein